MDSRATARENAQTTAARRRVAQRQEGYQLPAPEFNEVEDNDVEGVGPLSVRYRPSLETEELLALADHVSTYDIRVLAGAQTFYQKLADDRANDHYDQGTAAENDSKLRKIKIATEQLQDVQRGAMRFHEDVLANQFLINITGSTIRILTNMAAGPESGTPSEQHIIAWLVQTRMQFARIPYYLIRATEHGVLTIEIRAAMRQRWRYIDELSQWLKERDLLGPEDQISTWLVHLLSRIEFRGLTTIGMRLISA